MVARTFSSKINAASESSRNPIAIVQNVIDALEISFECFRVAITEIAKLTADVRVKKVPQTKLELKSMLIPWLVDESKTPPPTTPNISATYFKDERRSFKTIRLSDNTASGEKSMIAADKLVGMYFSPASCIGYRIPKADVAITMRPIHCFEFSGISIFFFMAFSIPSKQMVAIPKRSADDVKGPQAWRVYFDARKLVPQRMFATMANMNPELKLK